MEMRFVSRNASLTPGEILLTSGMDAACPKGIPVARVTDAKTGAMSVQEIRAEALADFSSLEEVFLLESPTGRLVIEPWDVYTPKADDRTPLPEETQPAADGTDSP
jgi:cell shape-determining protein MreC